MTKIIPYNNRFTYPLLVALLLSLINPISTPLFGEAFPEFLSAALFILPKGIVIGVILIFIFLDKNSIYKYSLAFSFVLIAIAYYDNDVLIFLFAILSIIGLYTSKQIRKKNKNRIDYFKYRLIIISSLSFILYKLNIGNLLVINTIFALFIVSLILIILIELHFFKPVYTSFKEAIAPDRKGLKNFTASFVMFLISAGIVLLFEIFGTSEIINYKKERLRDNVINEYKSNAVSYQKTKEYIDGLDINCKVIFHNNFVDIDLKDSLLSDSLQNKIIRWEDISNIVYSSNEDQNHYQISDISFVDSSILMVKYPDTIANYSNWSLSLNETNYNDRILAKTISYLKIKKSEFLKIKTLLKQINCIGFSRDFKGDIYFYHQCFYGFSQLGIMFPSNTVSDTEIEFDDELYQIDNSANWFYHEFCCVSFNQSFYINQFNISH